MCGCFTGGGNGVSDGEVRRFFNGFDIGGGGGRGSDFQVFDKMY